MRELLSFYLACKAELNKTNFGQYPYFFVTIVLLRFFFQPTSRVAIFHWMTGAQTMKSGVWEQAFVPRLVSKNINYSAHIRGWKSLGPQPCDVCASPWAHIINYKNVSCTWRKSRSRHDGISNLLSPLSIAYWHNLNCWGIKLAHSYTHSCTMCFRSVSHHSHSSYMTYHWPLTFQSSALFTSSHLSPMLTFFSHSLRLHTPRHVHIH